MHRRRTQNDWLIPLLSVIVVVQLVAGLTAAAVTRRASSVAPATGLTAFSESWTADPVAGSPSTRPLVPGASISVLDPGVSTASSPPGTRAAVAPDVATPSPASESPPAEPAPPAPASAPAAEPSPDAPPPASQQPAPPPPAPAPGPEQPAPDPGPREPAPEQPSAQQQQQQPMTYQSASVSDSERIFAEEFPRHAAARQSQGDPASFRWAVIVGVNAYQGRTRDTIGSVADATVLRDVLLAQGWREDHILVLTDGAATHDRIIRGIEWLIRSTDARSTAVFSFSGHMRRQGGDPDRDGVAVDVGLWPTDNRFIWDSDLGRMLGAVPAGRLWASLQGCHAGGLATAALEKPGRVVTYSSLASQKSYEDPEVGHSVQGFYLFNEGFSQGWADANKDGMVTVQEAHQWAAPRANVRTSGYQSPQLFDGLGGQPFRLDLA